MSGLVISVAGDPTFPGIVKLRRSGREPVEVGFMFRHKTTEELAEWSERAKQPTADKADLLEEIVAGWKTPRNVEEYVSEGEDFQHAAMLEQDFSSENLRALILNFIGAAEAIAHGYRIALVEGRRKN